MFRRSALALGSALGVVLASGAGFAQTGKVTVVTSFSKDVTDPIKKAFEKAVPGATLEVQNRNTNAGVKFIEETKGNNQVDLFWASAPDAFEVLKGKKLLSAYKPKATGIAEKVGSYRSTTRTASIPALRPRATASCGTSAT
jgi:ABC-type glycerol-3-phosphate transport system substrate-binding protein